MADATGIVSVVEDPHFHRALRDLSVRQLKPVGSHSLNCNIPDALDILKRDDSKMAKFVSRRPTLEGVRPLLDEEADGTRRQ